MEQRVVCADASCNNPLWETDHVFCRQHGCFYFNEKAGRYCKNRKIKSGIPVHTEDKLEYLLTQYCSTHIKTAFNDLFAKRNDGENIDIHIAEQYNDILNQLYDEQVQIEKYGTNPYFYRKFVELSKNQAEINIVLNKPVEPWNIPDELDKKEGSLIALYEFNTGKLIRLGEPHRDILLRAAIERNPTAELFIDWVKDHYNQLEPNELSVNKSLKIGTFVTIKDKILGKRKATTSGPTSDLNDRQSSRSRTRFGTDPTKHTGWIVSNKKIGECGNSGTGPDSCNYKIYSQKAKRTFDVDSRDIEVEPKWQIWTKCYYYDQNFQEQAHNCSKWMKILPHEAHNSLQVFTQHKICSQCFYNNKYKCETCTGTGHSVIHPYTSNIRKGGRFKKYECIRRAIVDRRDLSIKESKICMICGSITDHASCTVCGADGSLRVYKTIVNGDQHLYDEAELAEAEDDPFDEMPPVETLSEIKKREEEIQKAFDDGFINDPTRLLLTMDLSKFGTSVVRWPDLKEALVQPMAYYGADLLPGHKKLYRHFLKNISPDHEFITLAIDKIPNETLVNLVF